MDPTAPQPIPVTPVPMPTPPVPNPPPIETVVAQVVDETPKKSLKKWIILGLSGVLLFALVVLGTVFFLQKKTKTPTIVSSTPIVVPTSTPLPVTLAPIGTTEFDQQYWRTSRATMAEAQLVGEEVGPIFGALIIPTDLKFVHEEVYKGIPIKWTSGQPIPPGRLAWIKAGIDLLPPFFAVDHPITGIISATVEELKITDPLAKSRLSGAAAFASGFNIFVTNNILIDKPRYVPLKEKEMIYTLFHEWTHVVQYYEALQTFTEAYLKIPGNATIAISLAPFTKDFAKTAGWDFGEDKYANEIYPHLKTDTESQKTSDYGKTYYYEDQAETAASFLTCQTSNYSSARIKWMEKTLNTLASNYCN